LSKTERPIALLCRRFEVRLEHVHRDIKRRVSILTEFDSLLGAFGNYSNCRSESEILKREIETTLRPFQDFCTHTFYFHEHPRSS